jgi:chorismate dehydratase
MRLGITPYLNARPLARSLASEPDVELVFASPSRLADLLRRGWVDAALVSSSEYFNGDYVIVPCCAISSCGKGTDALLLSNVPLFLLRTVALDAASRSTNLLLQVAMHWLRPGAAIRYWHRPADSCRSLAEFDACLLIGDAALSMGHRAEHRYDLAEMWHDLTGLPMVLTLWLARPGSDAKLCDTITRACERGKAQLEEAAAAAAQELGWEEAFVRHYLTAVLDYGWTEKHARSLQLFGELLYSLGLVGHQRALQYLGEGQQEPRGAPSEHAT